MRVVEDRGDFVALYLQPGTKMSSMGDADGNRTRDFVHATRRIPTVWGLTHCLRLLEKGANHATVLFWDEHSWEFLCWYINLEEPMRRTSVGFDSMDLTLDLVVAPDRQSWQWKDEDEFAYGIEHGWYTEAQFAQLKEYGLRVLDDARAGAPPFDAGWEHWRPPKEWQPLDLPVGWDD